MKKPPFGGFINGAWGRDRTADTGIFSPLLYQLSYPGKVPFLSKVRPLYIIFFVLSSVFFKKMKNYSFLLDSIASLTHSSSVGTSFVCIT